MAKPPANQEVLSKLLSITSTTGKTTLARKLNKEGFATVPDHTTRERRLDEIAGVDKIFLTEQEFEQRFREGEYFEETLDFARYNGAYYGTLKGWVKHLKNGRRISVVVVVVSTTMAEKIKIAVQDGIAWVHLHASADTRSERLWKRGTSESEMQTRLTHGDSLGVRFPADIIIDTSTFSEDEVLRIVLDHVRTVSESK